MSTSKVINKISVKFDWIFLKVIHFDVNSDVNSSTVFHANLQAPSAGITATALLIWLSLIEYFKS